MSIATKLTKLETDITSAYTAVSNKGGTVPAHKNTENLADAITSITAFPSSNGFANDSWDTIAAICDAGLAPKYYNIGDSKTIHLSAVTDTYSGLQEDIQACDVKIYIVSFNTVTLADGTRGHMTMLMSPGNCTDDINTSSGPEWNLMRKKLPYAYFSYAGAGGMQEWLKTTLRLSFPEGLRNNLKTMRQKIYNNYTSAVGDNDTLVTIPNIYQLGFDYITGRWPTTTSFNAVRNTKNERPLIYFSDYNNRYQGFDHVTSVHITTADECSNWNFSYFTISELTQSTSGTVSQKDSSYYAYFLPMFTI